MTTLRPIAAAAALFSLFAASPAVANPIAISLGDTLNVQFQWVNPGHGNAGMYNWTSGGSYAGLVYADPNTNRFVSFCIERNQHTSGSLAGYQILPLEQAPTPGPHMSQGTANALRGMWAEYFDDLNTADEAAAFQNAVWYLIDPSYNPAFASNSTQGSLYDTYLNSGTWQSGLANLAVISNSNLQDQLVMVNASFLNPETPEPGMLALGLLVAPAIYLRRKLMKA